MHANTHLLLILFRKPTLEKHDNIEIHTEVLSNNIANVFVQL